MIEKMGCKQWVTASFAVWQKSSVALLCRRSDGFALIIVLWILVLVAFIFTHVIASGRTEISIARNLLANAVARAAADGAISEAIFNQLDPGPTQRWPIDGRERQLLIGDCRVVVRLENEAWWINPNTASPTLLEALLRVTGRDAESAHRLATAISEWVGSVAVARRRSLVFADYRAAGLDYGPPGAPLETLDELGRVLGMTTATLEAMRPHLTLFGPPQPIEPSADPVVAASLVEAARMPNASYASLAARPPPDVMTARIATMAFGPGAARVTRTAVVRVGAALPLGYAVLDLRDSLLQ
jgi:general secretion pathway protein K